MTRDSFVHLRLADMLNTRHELELEARRELEALELQLETACGRTRRERQLLRLRIQDLRRVLKIKKRIDVAYTAKERKARKAKAVARKLRWLATKDFTKMTLPARRAAKKLLRSDLTGKLLSVTPGGG